VTDKKVFGSYVRGTNFYRERQIDKSDIDVMIVFSNPNDYKPQSFFKSIERVLQNIITQHQKYISRVQQ